MEPVRGGRGGWGWVLGVLLWGCASGPEQAGSPAADRAREVLRGSRARSGNLRLTCEPADADVYLDGVVQGVCTDFGGTPRALQVGEGLHRVDVKKDGFWPYTSYYEPGSARAGLTIKLRPVGGAAGGTGG